MSIRESVHVGQFNQQIRNDVIGHVRQTSQIKKKTLKSFTSPLPLRLLQSRAKKPRTTSTQSILSIQ